MNRKLKDVFLKGNARVKYAQVRDMARKFMEYFGIKKECRVCGFDVYVEVAHIKAVSQFSEESLIKEVNSLQNMVYLCPNHHKMLDKGLLSLI